MTDQDNNSTSSARQTQVEVKEIRKGVLNNLTPKPPLPSFVTSSTGQSASTQAASTTPVTPTPEE